MSTNKVVVPSLHRTQDGVATKEIPPIVAIFAANAKMIPIAWHIEPTYVVIVFEQGPKIRFERQPQTVGAIKHVPPVLEVKLVSPAASVPVTRVAKAGKTYTARQRPNSKKSSKVRAS